MMAAALADISAADASRSAEGQGRADGLSLEALVPVIETERLILRAPRVSDFELMAEFYATERSVFVGGPKDRQESWRYVLMGMGHWLARGYGYWSVDERASGRMVGRVGVHFHAVDWPEPELGWHLFAGFEGRGLMTEAARAARAASARHFGLGPLISLIAPENARSQAVAQRLGAVFESRHMMMGKMTEVWRHPACGQEGEA